MRQLGEQVSSRFGLHGESREGPRDTSLAMRSSCQTRALTLDACEQGARPDATSVGHGWPSVSEAKDGGRGPCRRAGGKLLFPALLCKRVKAESGYDDRKGSERVIADPLSLGVQIAPLSFLLSGAAGLGTYAR